MRLFKLFIRKALLLSLILALSAPGLAAASTADKTTKYRVFQYDQALMEFANYNQAEQYARSYAGSRVEEIGSGVWLWNNYSRYQVYQQGKPVDNDKFARLDEAINEASNWSWASIRDLQGQGWVWDNYPRYQVYQGATTLDNWFFATMDEAIAEARKWGGSHIIDLKNNRWVWDNISSDKKQQLRQGEAVYRVYQGTYSADDWEYGALEDAIAMTQYWSNSRVVRISDNTTVFHNLKKYRVYQGDTHLESFIYQDDAVQYAEQYAHTSIQLYGQIIWDNFPTYTVYQGSNQINGFYTIPEALEHAMLFSNASIRNHDGRAIWNNFHQLQIWGWNGMSSWQSISAQLEPVMGLDVTSPSWFQLADATGALKDSSSEETVKLLKQRGLQVHPLVSNQFDSVLTSQFLADSEAQAKFIDALVSKIRRIGADGINLDFESLNGKDRAAFTAFVGKLAEAAHSNNLKLSVDLPRGSVSWNHLTAFDHEKLGQLVDYIVVMAYDHHYSGSTEPGSVAGLQWVEKGIQEYLSYGIPRDKLILGIPFYIREWTVDAQGKLLGNRAIYTKDLAAFIEEKAAVSSWDPAFNQFKVEYTGDDGNKRVFWLEDNDTVKARLALASQYELAGVAAWRLGQEDPSFWETILQNK